MVLISASPQSRPGGGRMGESWGYGTAKERSSGGIKRESSGRTRGTATEFSVLVGVRPQALWAWRRRFEAEGPAGPPVRRIFRTQPA